MRCVRISQNRIYLFALSGGVHESEALKHPNKGPHYSLCFLYDVGHLKQQERICI